MDTPVYQVIDWDTHFENNKSRERDQCSFVCVPNKQHGLGLAYILNEADGAAIYGIWCLILGACSRQARQQTDDGPKRLGYLTANGLPDGCPWSAHDLALCWRRRPEEIQRALDVLSGPKVGWIRVASQSTHNSSGNQELSASARQVPAECPSGALEGKGREAKGNEGEGSPSGNAPPPAVPSGKAKERKPRKPAEGPHPEVRDHYGLRFQETYGTPYHFDGSKDGKLVSEILNILNGDVAAAKATIDNYFALKDQFLTSRRHPIGTLRSQINAYTPSATPSSGSKASAGLEWKPQFTEAVQRELSRPPLPGEPDYVAPANTPESDEVTV